MKEEPIHIDTNDEALDEGAEAICDLLEEIEKHIALKTKRECSTCHGKEWMYPSETICWRCERIQHGLSVAKPNGETGWWWWNYRLNAWAPMPSDEERYRPEWGTLE